MAFRFRFETVLSYRRSLEELAQMRMAAAEDDLRTALTRLENLWQERQGMITDFEQKKRTGRSSAIPGARLSVAMLTFHVDLLEMNERQRLVQDKMIETCRRAVELARQALLERVRERKIMERLRERSLARYVQDERQREMKDNDEQAVLRHGRIDSLL